MTDQPRDWDKEMAAIDRAIEQEGPGAPAGRPVPGSPRAAATPSVAATPPGRRGSVAITWLWVLLAVALAVALPLWPYQRTCGLPTVFFIGAAGLTLLVGGLAAVSTWRTRRGFAHVLSLLVMLWAGGMAASEILPRVGYAREARSWTCAATPAAAPARAPSPASSAPATEPAPESPSPDASPSATP